MLPRVLEPEVMDAPNEALDYDRMDHAAVNRAFVADFLAAAELYGLLRTEPASGPEGAGLTILDLGTGTAQIPIELGRQFRRARVTAIDAAASMLALAQKNIANAGLADRILLEQLDAKALPYADSRFAAVMSNSIVHHIPEPREVLAEAVRVAAPGGLIFFRDLLRPTDDDAVCRLVDAYAAGTSAHQRALFDASLRAALALDEIRTIVAALGFAAAGVRQSSDRHWTWSAQKPG